LLPTALFLIHTAVFFYLIFPEYLELRESLFPFITHFFLLRKKGVRGKIYRGERVFEVKNQRFFTSKTRSPHRKL
jgi:hypothetical protein